MAAVDASAVAWRLDPAGGGGPAARHTPVDIDALLAAFPRLEVLHVCGAGHRRVP